MLLPSIDRLGSYYVEPASESLRSAPESVATARRPRQVPHTQELGPSERLFVAVRRFGAANVTRVMTLEGSLATSDIREAMALLQSRHPLLRARIVDGDAPYFVHNSAPLPRVHRVERRDDEHFRRVLESVLDTQVNPEHGPHFEAHFLQSERSPRAELILIADHAICDGMSMNSLCSELLDILAQRPLKPSQPILPVLAELLPNISRTKQALSFGHSFANFARIGAERALKGRRPAARSSAYVGASLGKQETSDLMARARKAGTTVTGALMAAVTVTLRDRPEATSQLAVSVPVNLRPRISGRNLDARHLGNYTSVAYLRASTDGSLWELARSMKERLDVTVRGDRLLAAANLIYRTGRHFVRGDRPPLAHAMISNSGVVPLERDYGRFRVVAFHSATSAPMLSADFSFFCNTFDGALTLNLLFSEELVSRKDAVQVLSRIRSQLTQA